MNTIMSILICCLLPLLAHGQTIRGYWKGAIAFEQEGMRIIVDLANDSTGRISYPDIGVSRMPIAQVSFVYPDLTLIVNDGSGQVQKF